MRTGKDQVREGLLLVGLLSVSLLFAAGAKAQQPVKQINTADGIQVNGGTSAGGPTANLSIAPGGIANSSLAHSSVTVGTGAGLSGGGSVNLGGALTLINTGVLSFNSRVGAVTPASGDYTFPLIGGTATKSQLPGTTVFTNQTNTFTFDQSITGSLNVSGTINLPYTTGSTVGVINTTNTLGNPVQFIHNFPGEPGPTVHGNTFVGLAAGNFNFGLAGTHGNTGFGYAAVSSINSTNADGNTGVGYLALGRTTTGFFNTSLGFQSGWVNEGGVYNVAIGPFALPQNVSGSHNIAIGYDSGDTANASNPNGDDNIYIGEINGSQLQGENNTIRIGNPNTSDTNHGYQTKTFIAGISGVTTGLTGSAVFIDSNGQLGTLPSSRRFKYDIHDMDNATNKLLDLRPVLFRYKQAQNDGSHPLQYGLVAEEVANVYPELVQYDPNTGEPNTVLYQFLPAMLVNEVQKQHRNIEAQQELIQSLQAQLAQLASQTQQLQTELTMFKAKGEKGSQLTAIAPQP